MNGITSRMPAPEYHALPEVSISRLKEIKRSPQHYQWALEHPKESPPLTLGAAAHCAVLEPERFNRDHAVWARRTDTGRLAPRNGKWWEAFQAENAGRTIITADEYETVHAIQSAVRSDPVAAPYLEAGEPEVVLQWGLAGRACRGRVDWLTTRDGERVLVGLKTARDCRPFQFGSAAARLSYHLQWAFYADGYQAITGKQPKMVEIVVESEAPHAVVVYVVPDDILVQGRTEYEELIKILDECERRNDWPGPARCEEILTLPTWVYGQVDDITELGLET